MTTNKNKTEQSLNNNVEVFGLDYFYKNFENKYYPKMLGEPKSKAKIRVSRNLYKKILIEYFDIYFKELYFLDGPSYFLYTGTLTKVKYRPRVIINNGIKKLINTTIGLMWYKRPSELFFVCCKILKQKGSTNRLPKIENLYKKNFDINLIVNFEEAIEAERINNNLYLP